MAKRVFFYSLVALVSLSQTNISQAGNNLKVSYRIAADIGYIQDSPNFYTASFLVNSSQAIAAKKKMATFAKLSSTKTALIGICKSMDSYNGRVKVTDARGGTAGLGNLRNVSVIGFNVVESIANLPDYSEEEQSALDEQYETEEDYPDYIEDGYVYYSIEADCLFTGTISLISSNAYRIYINGSAGPEYSKSELARMKWAITLVDN